MAERYWLGLLSLSLLLLLRIRKLCLFLFIAIDCSLYQIKNLMVLVFPTYTNTHQIPSWFPKYEYDYIALRIRFPYISFSTPICLFICGTQLLVLLGKIERPNNLNINIRNICVHIHIHIVFRNFICKRWGGLKWKKFREFGSVEKRRVGIGMIESWVPFPNSENKRASAGANGFGLNQSRGGPQFQICGLGATHHIPKLHAKVPRPPICISSPSFFSFFSPSIWRHRRLGSRSPRSPCVCIFFQKLSSY